jgi:hypothetical protein
MGVILFILNAGLSLLVAFLCWSVGPQLVCGILTIVGIILSVALKIYREKFKGDWKRTIFFEDGTKEFFKRYAHYYNSRFACGTFSSCASFRQFDAVIVAVLTFGHYWPLLFAVVYFFWMSSLAFGFSPIGLISQEESSRYHHHIILTTLGFLDADISSIDETLSELKEASNSITADPDLTRDPE